MRSERSAAGGERFARQQERLRRELDDSGLPVFALTGPALPGPECFGGVEQAEDRLTCVRVVHGGGSVGVPWAGVETARWGGTRFGSSPLQVEVEQAMRGYGHPVSAVDWTEGDVTLVVDGEAVAGRIVRAGRWWAARCGVGDVEISVLARDWFPEVLGVRAVAELAEMMARYQAGPPVLSYGIGAGQDGGPVPEQPAGEPHRVLVDVVLQACRERSRWAADGWPAPALPPYWRALWRAAVRRQTALADQPEAMADEAVSGIVSQLSTLRDRAAWFRDDERLRERAIAETLLFGTGLSEAVSSAAAQRAWLHREDTARRPELPVGPRVAADEAWCDAWSAWAAAHTPDRHT